MKGDVIMTKNFLFFDSESYSGNGYIIIDISGNPRIIQTRNRGNNPMIVESEDLESTSIPDMIKEARELFGLSYNTKIYVDLYKELDADYIASEGYLYMPNDYCPLDYDEDDLEDYAEYCNNL